MATLFFALFLLTVAVGLLARLVLRRIAGRPRVVVLLGLSAAYLSAVFWAFGLFGAGLE